MRVWCPFTCLDANRSVVLQQSLAFNGLRHHMELSVPTWEAIALLKSKPRQDSLSVKGHLDTSREENAGALGAHSCWPVVIRGGRALPAYCAATSMT